MIMEKNFPPQIDDTWYFRGQLIRKLPLLKDGENNGTKFRIVKNVALKNSKKYLWGHPTKEAYETEDCVIMGC